MFNKLVEIIKLAFLKTRITDQKKKAGTVICDDNLGDPGRLQLKGKMVIKRTERCPRHFFIISTETTFRLMRSYVISSGSLRSTET